MTVCDYCSSPRETYAIATLRHRAQRPVQRPRRRPLRPSTRLSLAAPAARAATSAVHRKRDGPPQVGGAPPVDGGRHLYAKRKWADPAAKDSGLSLKYTERATHYAPRKGRVDVLQWWKDSGLELKHNENNGNPYPLAV
ncbi:hypothetical protein DFJ73DRAFT_243357 [Zopfochytrium polystomum]|nr:hypothetical protein DFJ73DRAFT_243357 [Zopfochytrium polystomum]